jgi:flagellar hook-associated protein 3 FlgL
VTATVASSFRITQRSIGQSSLAGLQHNLGRLGNIQQQLSSGKQISKPSDSPTGTVSAMQLRSEIRTNQQWSRNAADGIGWLGTIDQTLTSSLDSVRRARDLTLQGMNSGATSAEAQRALAVEIDQLRDSLIGLANTTYLDRPVFGGTTSGKQAYQADGQYVGSGTANGVARTVGADATVRVDVTGPEVFGPQGADLFTVLGEIAANLRAGDTSALSANLNGLDTAMRTVQNKLAEAGARYNRVEQMQKAADDRVLALTNSLSGVEDIDLPKTIVDLKMQQMAYEAALGATQRIITPSLADFLR